MPKFIQLHYLTVYPPSNPNRDDIGQPKSAQFGGVNRLRISSQAIKRAARMSDVMQTTIENHKGARTRQIGKIIYDALIKDKTPEKDAIEVAQKIASVFGKVEEKDKDKDKNKNKADLLKTNQLVFISPQEIKNSLNMARKALKDNSVLKGIDDKEERNEKKVKEIKKRIRDEILQSTDRPVDIAMFGRMLADAPVHNREAAVQISHAITTHRAEAEDDYYAAVDDLQQSEENAGAGFIGTAGFGSGVYYTYAAIDVNLLMKNIKENKKLATGATIALAKALAIATPSGKRASFAHHGRALYIRAEIGDEQPRSLAAAFFSPVKPKPSTNMLSDSIKQLEETAKKMEDAYSMHFDGVAVMNVEEGEGALTDIESMVAKAFEGAG